MVSDLAQEPEPEPRVEPEHPAAAQQTQSPAPPPAETPVHWGNWRKEDFTTARPAKSVSAEASYRVEYLTGPSRTEVYAPPGTSVYFYDKWAGRTDANGQLSKKNAFLDSAGVEWKDYQVWAFMRGQWTLAKVDMKPGMRMVVRFL